HRLAHALLDRRDELLRDHAADDVVVEHVAGSALARLDLHQDVTELAATARLLRVLVLARDLLADRLAVRDLGLADVALDFELALQAVDDDLQVELAHATDDRLPRLFVGMHAERRVFRGELLKTDAELLDVALRLRLDRDRDDRLREDHLLEEDDVL